VLSVLPAEGLYPAVGMHSEGEEVRLNLVAQWQHSDVTLMSIDSCEEDWSRLHDVRINGQVINIHFYTKQNDKFTNKQTTYKIIRMLLVTDAVVK